MPCLFFPLSAFQHRHYSRPLLFSLFALSLDDPPFSWKYPRKWSLNFHLHPDISSELSTHISNYYYTFSLGQLISCSNKTYHQLNLSSSHPCFTPNPFFLYWLSEFKYHHHPPSHSSWILEVPLNEFFPSLVSFRSIPRNNAWISPNSHPILQSLVPTFLSDFHHLRPRALRSFLARITAHSLILLNLCLAPLIKWPF